MSFYTMQVSLSLAAAIYNRLLTLNFKEITRWRDISSIQGKKECRCMCFGKDLQMSCK